MIAENDINNFEKIVQAYRKADNAIKYEQEKLNYFKVTEGGLNSSFNIARTGFSTLPTVVYTLEAAEIIPIIEERLKRIKLAKGRLKAPRLASVTTTED